MADIARDDDPIDTVELDDAPAAPADPDVVVLEEEGEASLPPGAAEQEDGTVRLVLRRPVALRFKRGEAVREEGFDVLVFHPLTGADMRVISAKPPESITPAAIARSLRMHEGKLNALYDRLDARDATAAQRCVMHFLVGGPPTGR